MRYGSVCSGIEAASVAWESLGWQPAWFAEIEAFPSAVLAHHWPHVTNLGDMTKIAAAVRAGDIEAPDVLVGGTPCQAFSIAGLRNGLADKRGQLTLSYVELANAVDDKRRERGEEEAIIVWENVPGVLSSKDNAFGCFLAGLAGESSELQPTGGKWPNAGCVYGPSRIVAWRVLDAQFFGVAQRRRRVFVVASARKGFDPAEVLFEFDSMRRDTPPRREPQTAVTTDAGSGIEGGSHWDNPANPHPTLNQSNNIGGIGASNQEIFAQRGAGIVGAYRMTAFGEYSGDGTASTVKARDYKDATDLAVTYSDVSRTLLSKSNDSMAEDLETYAIHGTQDPDANHELAHTLGRNHGQENACIAFSYKDNGADATVDMSPTLRAGNHDTSHANSGQPPAICIQHASIGRHDAAGPQGKGYQEDVAFTQDSRASADVVQFGIQVRRLTPIECERLQGFPDNHTQIPWRGKAAADCPDGPRYKAIGNSMAVPVMRWIGERIAEALPIQEPTPRRWQRPFLKWAGGKYSLLPELERLIPAGKRLIEPFVGGGSVFLNSDKHERFLLADINADLINLYQMLAVAPDSVIAEAIKAFRHLNDAENYTAIREAFNAWQLNAIERAAAFLYLNRHCFNGLMRYNLDGFFNVGWGKYKAPYFPEKELMAFRKKSSACVFMNAGFERTLRLAGDGDVVYCDPPYEPMPGTAGFTSYASGGFSWDSQVALAESCVAAHQRGAKVFISNSTAPRVIELYERHGFTLHRVNARRSISSKGSTRETANDIVASLGI
ncbi:Dam family site-specific DNA-(adenine-N6)-methyltransferase [Salmonella enterica]|uniref:site-specific DNA-methyltransferase (adenine-specific) n=7 Tax=Salmonella enterica TaxID=28901 RepID=A0A6X6R8F3_SALEN|nr:Dam family site-specific DNA-(adenine-N6)-methyltransferase [Salmonella enterica]EAW1968889.1 Dam family site-specific DNA-(adenine-N6)-methyltransferase [Salmonella enterica subsp. enterica]EBX8090182.1 Dam family site-specific DNA-(adenine-N6)-methyltransferase [Salmonella enterica subsp. enterica serovar Choleraesuis]ECK9414128.1 Dam family site-specific DNA-(adenine-N6)-methyltransferase [Salmonella enterica subsp. enterica serovar Typhisuis str. CFSAN000655]ECK9464237.1 Dam family site-